MNYIKTQGLVIRTIPYRETDKLFTLFTLEEGKISAIARGVRKAGSKHAQGVDIFTRGDFLLYRKKGMATITQVAILESYYTLRNDMQKYALGAYFCELLSSVLEENEPLVPLYQLSCSALAMLEMQGESLPLYCCALELKALNILGMQPCLESCVLCDSPTALDFFSLHDGGVICKECRTGQSASSYLPISPGARSTILALDKFSLDKISRIKAQPSIIKEVSRLIWLFLQYNTDIKKLKSRKFLEAQLF